MHMELFSMLGHKSVLINSEKLKSYQASFPTKMVQKLEIRKWRKHKNEIKHATEPLISHQNVNKIKGE